ILRALGMRRREVMRLILFEAGAMGLLGAGFGLVWGYGLARVLTQRLTNDFLVAYGIHAAAVQIEGQDVLLALAVGSLASIFAAWGPARQTVTISPVEAMRPDEVSAGFTEQNGSRRALAGLALVAAGALFIRRH